MHFNDFIYFGQTGIKNRNPYFYSIETHFLTLFRLLVFPSYRHMSILAILIVLLPRSAKYDSHLMSGVPAWGRTPGPLALCVEFFPPISRHAQIRVRSLPHLSHGQSTISCSSPPTSDDLVSTVYIFGMIHLLFYKSCDSGFFFRVQSI